MKCRQEENARIWFRSERVFASGNDWYFHTREGIDVGPYESQFEAEIEAGLVKELLRETSSDQVAIAVIRDFVLDSFTLGRPLLPTFAHDDLDARRPVMKA